MQREKEGKKEKENYKIAHKRKFASLFENKIQGRRMNYYPPCVQAKQLFGLMPQF